MNVPALRGSFLNKEDQEVEREGKEEAGMEVGTEAKGTARGGMEDERWSGGMEEGTDTGGGSGGTGGGGKREEGEGGKEDKRGEAMGGKIEIFEMFFNIHLACLFLYYPNSQRAL